MQQTVQVRQPNRLLPVLATILVILLAAKVMNNIVLITMVILPAVLAVVFWVPFRQPKPWLQIAAQWLFTVVTVVTLIVAITFAPTSTHTENTPRQQVTNTRP